MIVGGIELTELEQDALTEVVNIGVSRAAAALRKMVGKQVLLSVPAVEIVTRERAATLLGERESDELVAVRQSFAGAFSGRAMLIFPEDNSLDLVRAVTGDELSPEEVVEMEEEALSETGNVILNGCLATMANMLKRPLTMSIPVVFRGGGSDLFNPDPEAGEDGLVLFLYINFTVLERNLRGYIAMMMDMPSLATLKDLLGQFIAEVVGEAPQ
ncbi:chemotaxis protein CheX [Sphingomonas deserti]|uniref:Chemotaxis protein CheX n=1 Tax=Allosphingosinicella deserti TaxID=2116704 RepID=A0A2P7QYM7_9SPHN|nr:chemotaxis protein CheX [Sphingomonas deserti]PSJ43064.1 chemotaxis protein CheX [Sphingomonas deserti]